MIIGSSAMSYYFPDFPRDPKDLDYVVESGPIPNTNLKVEKLPNPILLEYCGEQTYLEPQSLLTLKASHLAWDIFWDKHMFDCQFLIEKGYRVNIELFHKLYRYWNDYHGKNKRSNLQMSKEDFFNNTINNEDLEHDFLHTLINPSPTYKKTLKENKDVETDESKFWSLTYEDRLNIVREECMVMASERFRGDYFKARYYKMLKKFIQGHCPVYMIPFIVENFRSLDRPPFDFMEKINRELRVLGKRELV